MDINGFEFIFDYFMVGMRIVLDVLFLIKMLRL